MDQFTLDDELEMMSGIRDGLGPYEKDVMPWIELKQHTYQSIGACVDVYYNPPGVCWRMEKVVLAEVPDGRLLGLSKLVGHHMAAYHRKHKKRIDEDAANEQS